ncbi:GEVED domain-containing protein [Winogradskyella sp.]|uniref:GEVED domain-containing protein n=1 Tax=Winogradskyella sp. TaxID=1883156 RepID=UPI0026389781|nr:GEVED domain-containing protein [Winogradskyella sp.]
MKSKYLLFYTILLFFSVTSSFAQTNKKQKESQKAISYGKMQLIRTVPSIADQIKSGTFIPAEYEGEIEAPPKRRHGNRVVPGKGSDLDDPARQTNLPTRQGRAPEFVFTADDTPQAGVTDPTGAVGPNHYLAAWNVGFRIFDKTGNPLIPEASLGTILTGNTTGDPIVLYDPWVDRYIITEFDNNPNGFEMAISQGPDPVNDGWFVYINTFPTPAFPDYTKFSIWSDGYYVTANIFGGATNEGVWVVERDKIILGEPAQYVGLPLTGLEDNGFYSPQGFNVTNGELPPPGNFPVVYMQDDAWAGVSNDHLKIWTVNVDWDNISNSTISAPVELGLGDGVSPFTSVFDGGGFSNLSQPNGGVPVDALQAIIMNQAQYRRFCDYNSAVFNFVVDTQAGPSELAGVRWYELRQTIDGGPWTVYQEGTYTVPGGVRDAFSASMAMDIYGNIGMAYTSVGTNPGEEISIRYTGRLADDPLGDMTIGEELIFQSTANNPGVRLADYVHLTVDPSDDATFWHIAEVFMPQRSDVVGVFKIDDSEPNDAAIISVDSPISSTLSNAETITVTIENYGNNTLTSIPVSYAINGGANVNETWTGSLAPGTTVQYSFTQTADLSSGGEFEIETRTNIGADTAPQNDCFGKTVTNISPNDIGITAITSPLSSVLGNSEQITVTVTNFGGAPQTNFPITYTINGAGLVTETFTGTLAVGESVPYTFSATADLSVTNQTYLIESCTALASDEDMSNDCTSETVTNILVLCMPEATSGCGVDGIKRFILEDIDADDGGSGCNTEPSSSPQGYADRRNLSTDLDRSIGNNSYTIEAQQNWTNGIGVEVFSVWIDFDDSGTFEDSERLISGEFFTAAGSLSNFTLNIPVDANLGPHTLRAKAIDGSASGDILNPCTNFAWGEVHDYTVNIVDSTLSVDDFELENSSFTIITLPNNQFKIDLKTLYSGPITFKLFNTLGQQLVFNNISKQGDVYTYDLDMSYASSGVYIVKIGIDNSFKTGRIIVK